VGSSPTRVILWFGYETRVQAGDIVVAEPVVALHTTTAGDVAEAYLTARLLERGTRVRKPVGDDSRYDLVVDEGSGFLRVQVKTAHWADERHEGITYPACSNDWHRGTRSGYRGECDLRAVYFPPLRMVMLIPVDDVGTTEVRSRPSLPRNGQRLAVRFAKDYEV